MILALDTQILVWLATGDKRLSAAVARALGADNELLVSAVTAWEFVDLEQRGRFGGVIRFEEVLERFNLTVIDFPAEAWRLASALPDLHRDPVDRMLIAHVIHADMVLVTADKLMREYPVRSLW